MRTSFVSVGLVLASFLPACAAPIDGADTTDSESEALTHTTYVSIDEYLSGSADLDGWYDLRSTLAQQFDDICGDTFCEGDYANLASLEFSCSVSKVKGSVKQCAWIFAGSQEVVTASKGKVVSDAPHFVCKVHPKLDAHELVTALASPGKEPSIHRILPGLGGSLYDALGDCFDAPKGGSKLPNVGKGDFVDAVDVLDAAGQDAWFDAKAALQKSFDDVCGDTFCEGDYANITSLSFTCGANKATGAVSSCLWVFAASSASVTASTGNMSDHARAFRCEIPVSGSIDELVRILSGQGEVDAIHRPLPGGAPSLYDALGECL